MGKTYQSVALTAPVDTVWQALRNFHDMSWSKNVVTTLEIVGDRRSDQVGAKRVLNDAFQETLIELSDADRSLRYSIDDGPSPVSKSDVQHYVGTIQVRPITEGGGTFVEWSSTWDAKDGAAQDFCHGIYVALLADLKASVE